MPAVETIVILLLRYQYWILLPAAVVEGPIVATLSGFLVSLGVFQILPAFLILVAGDILGDTLYYALGFWSRVRGIPSWLKYIGITEDRVRKLESYFDAHGEKIVLLSKTQAIGAAILFSAGVGKMPFRKYLLYNALGTIPKVLLFGLIGVYFGKGYSQIKIYIDYAGMASFLLALFLIGIYVFVRKYASSRNKALKI